MAKLRAISTAIVVLLLATGFGAAAEGDFPFGQIGPLRDSLTNARIPGKPLDTLRNIEEKSGKIFIYEIEAMNTYQYDMDDTSRAIAEFIQKSGLENQCVDLKILKFRGPPSDTYGLVLRSPIPETKYQELANFICTDHPDCSIRVNSRPVDVSEIFLLSFGFAPNDHRDHPETVKKFALTPGSVIPAFSNACRSGKFEDSMNDAASTPNSRKFLKEIGVDIRQSRALSLADSNGLQFWDFGFPNHDRDE